MKRWVHASTNKFNTVIGLARSLKEDFENPVKDAVRQGNNIIVFFDDNSVMEITEAEIDDQSYYEKLVNKVEGR